MHLEKRLSRTRNPINFRESCSVSSNGGLVRYRLWSSSLRCSVSLVFRSSVWLRALYGADETRQALTADQNRISEEIRSFPYRYRPLHGWRRDDNSGVAGNSRSVQEAWHGLDCGRGDDSSQMRRAICASAPGVSMSWTT